MKNISEINLKNPTEEDIEAIDYHFSNKIYSLEVELLSPISDEDIKQLQQEANEEEKELKNKGLWGKPLKERQTK